jgi:hypothetical protein
MQPDKRLVLVIVSLWALMGAVSLRFEPPEFRSWERLYDADERRFAASHALEMKEIGDLGYKSWVRALQHPRTVVFTTDRWGYRNSRDIESPRVVVIGDSYVAGSGLSDAETVTARLAARLGEPVYNLATEVLNAPALFLREKRFSERKPAVVIWAPVARGIRPRPLIYRGSDDQAPEPLWTRVGDLGDALASQVERWNRDNGLTREMRFAVQSILHDFRGHPQQRRLADGQPVLALSLLEQGLLHSAPSREVGACIQMVAAFDQILRRAGVRFLFSPIPESGSIYPELFPETERRTLAEPSFFAELLRGTRAAGVEVVDLRAVYRDDPVPYLFLPDDSHWNARATDLAAAAWAEQLAPSEALAARDQSPRSATR